VVTPVPDEANLCNSPLTGKKISVTGVFINNEFVPSVDSQELLYIGLGLSFPGYLNVIYSDACNYHRF
jgi:hypothetical protein